ISDLIVVMKEGVIQQVGKPHDVYDDPVNLFVAKFLGTPPINVFAGRIVGGKLRIGSEAVMDAAGVTDQDVYVAIRPEGFVLSDEGEMTCALRGVEVMGRDITVVAEHPDAENPTIRAIISAENKVDTGAASVRFRLKPDKVFVFGRDAQERIRID
ncbi:MAG: ABC transporter ATP-binding protein, partial [Clostridia bacterium]|nr:ABC transporter ATP-binding protein [Clostridia bacterium]